MFAMLSPTSLAGLSNSAAGWFRPVREVNPAQGAAQGRSQSAAPLVPLTSPSAGGQGDGGAPSKTLPRGSLLDLSV
jgi:hypothetical protein